MEKNTIEVIGDCTVDSILEVSESEACLLCDKRQHNTELCFKYGEKIPVGKVTRSFGGGALNVSTALAKLGLNPSILTHVGADNEGDELLKYFIDSGIEHSNIIKSGPSNCSTIIIYNKERTIFSYHAKRKYDDLKLNSKPWIYLASAGQGSEEIIDEIIVLKNEGSKIIFNPGSWELHKFDLFTKIVSNSEILILNKVEAENVIMDSPNIKEILSAIMKMGPKLAVITDAANGAYLSNGAEDIHVATIASKIKDTTGAGDSFASAFLAGIINNKSVEESAKWGMVNSASVIEKVGATEGLLDLDSIISETEKVKFNISKI